MNAPEKIVDRQRFLGGSDAAAIIGRSPWDTPLTVYLWKVGQPTEDMLAERERKAKLFRRGKREEPYIIDDLEEDYGVKVTKRSPPNAPNRYTDPEHEFLSAEVDFEWEVTPAVAHYVSERNPEIADLVRSLIGTTQNGEAKSVHHFASAQFGQAETEDVPIYYAAQAMHGLMVTGRQLCMFAVRVGNGDVTIYWVVRDDETIRLLRPRLVRFWNEHVIARQAPEPSDYSDVVKLFRKAPASIVEASPEVLQYCEQLQLAKNAKAAAEEQEIECKYQIGLFVLGREGIALGNGGKVTPTTSTKPGQHQLNYQGMPLLTINLQSQNRIDSDRLRLEHPEIAAECSKTLQSIVFRKPSTKSRKR